MTEGEEPVDDLTVLGLLFLPVVFVWFLLRRRYSKEIRIGAGIYAGFILLGLAMWAWKLLAL